MAKRRAVKPTPEFGSEAEEERDRDDPAAQVAAGVEYAIRQYRGLIGSGVPGLHIYLFNKAEATRRILATLNLPRYPHASGALIFTARSAWSRRISVRSETVWHCPLA
ncbi:MAG: hypothetical protein A2X36_11925 [Elusimicrobia bacterium GWA2_69_24]|nr:MAG: hypothetical protein A2X36_11925 [Elusimicrobia bacterium GWA2_69_24]HBL18003.1 hypothetical protein [Elusimicrobiota bacterium]